MKILIKEYERFFSFKIETKKYHRYILIYKIGFFKYLDVKLMKDCPKAYKRDSKNKWFLVPLQLFPFIIYRPIIFKNPSQKPRVIAIDKYIYAFLIASVGFGIFVLIFSIINFFYKII